MSPKKIFFLDIDGTFVSGPEEWISPQDKKVIERLQKCGHRVILCTGRSPAGIARVSNKIQLSGIHIAYNGALIYDDNGKVHLLKTIEHQKLETFLHQEMTDDIFAEIDIITRKSLFFHLSQNPGLASVIRSGDRLIRNLEDWEGSHEEAIILMARSKVGMRSYIISKLQQWRKRKFHKFTFQYYESYERNVIFMQITAKNVNKYCGIKFCCKLLQTSIQNAIFIGDGDNDYQAIKHVRHAFCPSNATTGIKNLNPHILHATYAESPISEMINVLVNQEVISPL